METSFSIVFCKSGSLGTTVVPPDDLGIYNFARIPDSSHKIETWVDETSPFPHPIPVGARWMYTVHPVLESGDAEYPLKAGQMVGGPFLDVEEARVSADKIEKMGWFVCIYAALIVSDKNKLT